MATRFPRVKNCREYTDIISQLTGNDLVGRNEKQKKKINRLRSNSIEIGVSGQPSLE